MNALEMLRDQHKDVQALFDEVASAPNRQQKLVHFEELADRLATHSAIEEHRFYPAAFAKSTEDILLALIEGQLSIRRILAELLTTDVDSETFTVMLKILRKQVEYHTTDEEDDLFPKVTSLLDAERLEEIGQQMLSEMTSLEGTAPRRLAARETKYAGHL